MKLGLLACVSLSLACCGSAAFAQSVTPWNVRKVRWETVDNRGYSEFVATLGAAVEARKCRTLDQCLRHKDANPAYWRGIPATMKFYADCADLPYLVRAFYAWRNNLPFSYVDGVEARVQTENRDLRATPNGNVVESRNTPLSTSAQVTFERVKATIVDHVSSYSYRILDRAGEAYSDFYSPAIKRDSIVPGTIIYDPNGHVALVYKVTDDGNVYFIDAHPDNSLTSGTFGKKFERSRPNQAAGFKNWRPISLENARTESAGVVTSGKVKVAGNEQIASFSDEQYSGNAPREGGKVQFKINGEAIDWYEFVRSRLSRAGSKKDPIAEIERKVNELCSDLNYRAAAVDLAVQARLPDKDHPEKLPKNIYQSDGDWENYSTPSRDVRTKVSFVELREQFEYFISEYANKPHAFQYAGSNLKADLSKAYRAAAKKCSFSYQNSAKKIVKLDYFELQRRLFKMSFDPYHCPELRWGASGSELSTCPSNEKKLRWYEAEQRLRNQTKREYDDKTDFTVDELNAKPAGSGVDHAPAVDVDHVES